VNEKKPSVFKDKLTLVIGGTGKTGRRVAARLTANGAPVRTGSRSADPAFDWDKPETWCGALDGVHAVYVTYYPDLLVPEAAGRIGAFAKLAVARGARRLVLLSGRGEDGAVLCENALKASGADWIVLRASWFMQNFSESFLLEPLLAGEVALPVGAVGEPFIHADDIADMAVEAFGDDRHIGQTYELTGPALLTFGQAIGEISAALGRDIAYRQITPAQFNSDLAAAGLPDSDQALFMELFTEVLDGRNAYITDDIARVLGRPPRAFANYVRETLATDVWRTVP